MQNVKKSVFLMQFPFESTLLEPRKYFDEYRNLLYEAGLHKWQNNFEKKCQYQFYQSILGITSEEVDELNEVTSESHLDCVGEIQPMDFKLHESSSSFLLKYELNLLNSKTIAEEPALESLRNRKEDLSSRCNLKYEQYIWHDYESLPDIQKDCKPHEFSAILFCIKVYHPYLSYKGHMFKMKLLQEIHILGDQCLSQLKDKISCSMDYIDFEEIGNYGLPIKNIMVLKKKVETSSSFILIENKLYNDTRVKLKDLSGSIVKWAESSGLGPFSVGSMDSTQMIDLKLRIGHPYVYQHQGDCEHVLVVSDIHFLRGKDPHKTINFPRVYASGRSKGKYCILCGTRYARWLVMKNKRLTHDRTYFCDKCFKSYNYINGKKVGEFQAYQYVDPIAIL